MIVPTLLLAAQLGGSTDLHRTFAAGEKEVFVMLPPEPVCGSATQQVLWTADGSSLVALRMAVDASRTDMARLMMGGGPSPEIMARMKARVEIVTWALQSRKARTVLSLPAESSNVQEVQPMAGTDRIVFETHQRLPAADGGPERQVEGIDMLSTGTGTIVRLEQTVRVGPETSFDLVVLSPNRPLGLIQRIDNQRSAKSSSVRFFGASGSPGPWLKVATDSPLRFDDEGRPGYIFRAKLPDGKAVVRFQRMDQATGKPTTAVDYLPRGVTPAKPAEAPSLRVEAVPSVAASPIAPGVFLRVRGGKPDEAGIVSTDGTSPVLSPKNDAIAYVSQGGTMVRLLAPMPRESYDQALLAAQRSVAVSNAKQAALAVIMFAGDNDDVYPAQDSDVRSKIAPYLKNDAILNGFTYTFAGGSMVGIEKPAETEIGYVAGPGGRAVAYADGHVRWIPDQP